jgi:hypothetical protein
MSGLGIRRILVVSGACEDSCVDFTTAVGQCWRPDCAPLTDPRRPLPPTQAQACQNQFAGSSRLGGLMPTVASTTSFYQRCTPSKSPKCGPLPAPPGPGTSAARPDRTHPSSSARPASVGAFRRGDRHLQRHPSPALLSPSGHDRAPSGGAVSVLQHLRRGPTGTGRHKQPNAR